MKSGRSSLRKRILRNSDLYLFLLPALLVVLLFSYVPMYGVQIAFKDFNPTKGIFGSAWVGFKQFERFFNSYQFNSVITNTLFLSLYNLAAAFPAPIILALMINQIRVKSFQKVVQTTVYLPHFISTVVMVGMIMVFLSPTEGIYAMICRAIGVDPQVLLGQKQLFRSIYVWTDVWQHTGWDSIIYLAALSGIDPTYYEAATVDGASKVRQIIHIDIPCLVPTIVTLLILRTGGILSVGFEKIYLLQNPLNTPVSEVISTYVYKVGIQSTQYSYSAAIGLFNSLVNFIMLAAVNFFVGKVSDSNLF